MAIITKPKKFATIKYGDKIDIEAPPMSVDISETRSSLDGESYELTITMIFSRQPDQGMFLSPRDKACSQSGITSNEKG